MQHSLRLLSLAACLLLAGCEVVGDSGEVDYGAVDEIRFSQHVLPLLQDKFAPLLEDETGLRLTSWETLMAGSDFGEVVIPFDADNSLLLELATKLDPPHPSQLGADSLTQEEIAFVRRWLEEGARNDAGEVPYADAENLLYVANQDDASISVIDMDANVVIRTVKLADFGFTGAPKPHHIAVEPDGSHWYVSLIGGNTVLQFTRENELAGRTEAFETPGMLAVHPTEDLLYAGRSLSAVDPPRSIGVIRRSDMALEEVGVFFEKPHALRVSPDGVVVYSASLVTNQIAAIATATHDVTLTTLPGPQQVYVHLAIAPDGRMLYTTGQVSSQIQFIEVDATGALNVAATLGVNAAPWHPALTPDGRRLYVGNKAANTVTIVDTAQREVAQVIGGNGLAQPHGAATSPDGRFAYVSNNNTQGTYTPRYDFGDNAKVGTVVVIDTATNAIVKVLEVEENAAGMNRAEG